MSCICSRIWLGLRKLGSKCPETTEFTHPSPQRTSWLIWVIFPVSHWERSKRWGMSQHTERGKAGTFEKRGASRQHNVGEQRSPQIHVWLLNGKNEHFMKSFTFLPYQVRPEQELWGSETGRANLREQKDRRKREVWLCSLPTDGPVFLRWSFRIMKLPGHSCSNTRSQVNATWTTAPKKGTISNL